MDIFVQFPEREELIRSLEKGDGVTPFKVNNHIHSPYSFSAFNTVEEAVLKAGEEGIRVLGINDFNVTDGYNEFIQKCREQHIFPLLNIELIGISEEHRVKGIRINDPNNPGRIYISGKGLAHPSVLGKDQQLKLDRVVQESNRQVSRMIELLNGWLERRGTGISLSVEEIMEHHARHLLRERHVAKALRLKVDKLAHSDEEFFTILKEIYDGEPPTKRREDIAGTEEELRSKLLKSGAPAFVLEDDRAFLALVEITELIKNAGGVPTYPILLDGAAGKITEFENDRERLMDSLLDWGFHSVELIPMRNSCELLKAYAEYFYKQGFVVSFGTEHNTSDMRPLTVQCRDDVALDPGLFRISFLGVAYMAAHQYLVYKEGADYTMENRAAMEKLGLAVFNHYF